MCGIVGVLGFENSGFRVTKPYLARLRDQMIHRGPDGAGLWIDPAGKVGLGHRRLAIVDLSPEADQPMCNEDEASGFLSTVRSTITRSSVRSSITFVRAA